MRFRTSVRHPVVQPIDGHRNTTACFFTREIDMNLLIRPCLAIALALASTAPFAQSYTPPAGLAAAGAPGESREPLRMVAGPADAKIDYHRARRH